MNLLLIMLLALAQERVAEPPIGPFHQTVMDGVRTIANKEIEIIRLHERMANDESFRQKGNEKLLTEALEQLPPDVLRTISPLPPTMYNSAQEMTLHSLGLSIVRASCAKDSKTKLTADDLFEVVSSSDLMEDPGPAYPDIQKFFDTVRTQYPTVALRVWYPNVAYMMFGALHTPAFWPAGDEGKKAREQFISRLLEFTCVTGKLEHVADCIDIALRPPLEYDGKTYTWCAPGFDRYRGKVGFTTDHLAFVETFNQDAEKTRREGQSAELASFFAMLKVRMLQELDPQQVEEAHVLSAKFGTFDERKAYYLALAQMGWRAFWNEAHVDMEKMLAGTFPHSLDQKIAALREQLAASPENGGLADQLAQLESQRRSEQNEIMEHIARIFARDGDPAFVRDELIRLSSALDGRHVFDSPWMMIVQRDKSWASDALTSHIEDKKRLPAAAVSAAIAWLGESHTEAEKIVLMKTALDGSAFERTAAMAAVKLSSEEADIVCRQGIDDLEALARNNANASDRTVLLSGVVRMLYAHRSEAWVKGALLETFDARGVSLWPGDVRFSADKDDPVLAWISGTLSDEEKQSLDRRKLLPPSLRGGRTQHAASGS